MGRIRPKYNLQVQKTMIIQDLHNHEGGGGL